MWFLFLLNDLKIQNLANAILDSGHNHHLLNIRVIVHYYKDDDDVIVCLYI